MTFKQSLRKAFGSSESRSSAFRRRKPGQPSRSRYRPQVQLLEDRLALATLLVTSLADSGVGTLRAAIMNSSNHTAGGTGNDTIEFSPTIDGGTIDLITRTRDGGRPFSLSAQHETW